MKTRITKTGMAIAILVTGFLMTSCEDTDMPTIDMHEFGYENTGTASPGGDLHMDAEIVAEGTIDEVRIEIHGEDSHKKDGDHSAAEGWEVDEVFADYSGLKNATFHEHIEVPETSALGMYHFYMKVTDMEGNQTVYEADLELKEGVEADHDHAHK